MKTGPHATSLFSLVLMLFVPALALPQSITVAQSSNSAATPTISNNSTLLPPDSHVRIVRLSEVRGEVQIDRNTGDGLETAILNLPVVEGSRLRTGDGFAEIEFEDNSTLRLTPHSLVEFRQLQLGQSGATSTRVNIERGTIYAKLARTKGNEFTLSFGKQVIRLNPSSHVRLQVSAAKAKLAVFGGNVQVEGPSGTISMSNHRTVSFDQTSGAAPASAKGIAEGRYDTWDQAAIDYHNRPVKSSAYRSSTNLFGQSDMSYYGGFVNAADCGRIWRPYFAGIAWDPFANGAWVWYPVSGYSWVSPYPWGWTAFHSGEWEYCPANGWGWRPRAGWVGLSNLPSPIRPPHGFPRPIPPKPPSTGASTILAVSRNPLVASGLSSTDKFVIRKDSAGLGIPRGTFESLSHISSQVEQRGSASFEVSRNSATIANGRASNNEATSSSERASAARGGQMASARASSGGASYPRTFAAAETGGRTAATALGERGGLTASMGSGVAGSGRR